MSAHRSKHLDEYMGKIDFDYLITVCGNADERCPFFPGMGTRLHWPFEDPAAFVGPEPEKLAAFQDVRDQIKAKIQSWLEEIRRIDSPRSTSFSIILSHVGCLHKPT
jgi:arsenate reductase (thioredoxin)